MATTISEIEAFFDAEFPENTLQIEALGDRSCVLRRQVSESDLRPGGTVSGPFMMALVDTALYVAILGELGIVALAVTTNLNINFLKRPVANADVIARCHLMKVGRRLVVGEVTLYSDGEKDPIAHATGTYSIPKLS